MIEIIIKVAEIKEAYTNYLVKGYLIKELTNYIELKKLKEYYEFFKKDISVSYKPIYKNKTGILISFYIGSEKLPWFYLDSIQQTIKKNDLLKIVIKYDKRKTHFIDYIKLDSIDFYDKQIIKDVIFKILKVKRSIKLNKFNENEIVYNYEAKGIKNFKQTFKYYISLNDYDGIKIRKGGYYMATMIFRKGVFSSYKLFKNKGMMFGRYLVKVNYKLKGREK